MPKAKLYPVCFEVECPHRKCHETVPAPNGSEFWTREELELKEGQEIMCPNCGTYFVAPRVKGVMAIRRP
jgi:DNA-directed RNA polymerase subunit RPC12/RpoP